MPRVQRMIGIIVCGGLLLIPQVVCFAVAPPAMMKVADFIRLCFPLTFYVLVNLCIDEGRERERECAAQKKQR